MAIGSIRMPGEESMMLKIGSVLIATAATLLVSGGDAATANSVHYAYDPYALARGTGSALAKDGKKSWYFLTADYAFGHALEADTTAIVKAMGGEVVGATRYPVETFDQSSFLLQAQ